MTKHGRKANRFVCWLAEEHLDFRFHGRQSGRGESLYVVVALPVPHGEIIVRFSDHRMVPGGCYSKILKQRLPQPHLSVDPFSGRTVADAKELLIAKLAAIGKDDTLIRRKACGE